MLRESRQLTAPSFKALTTYTSLIIHVVREYPQLQSGADPGLS